MKIIWSFCVFIINFIKLLFVAHNSWKLNAVIKHAADSRNNFFLYTRCKFDFKENKLRVWEMLNNRYIIVYHKTDN